MYWSRPPVNDAAWLFGSPIGAPPPVVVNVTPFIKVPTFLPVTSLAPPSRRQYPSGLRASTSFTYGLWAMLIGTRPIVIKTKVIARLICTSRGNIKTHVEPRSDHGTNKIWRRILSNHSHLSDLFEIRETK